MNVEIRPQKPEDGETSWLYKHYVNMWTYAVCESPIPVMKDTEVQFYKECAERNDCIRYAIEADGVYVGNIFVDGIRNGLCELHTHIFNCGYWGKGVATKAHVLFLDKVFERDDINVICELVACKNKSNVAIANKIGFDNIATVQGKINECYYFEITREQWKEKRNTIIL